MAEKFMLLVEDNPDDEILTLHALQENKILNRVVVARDGVEALETVMAEQIDLVVCDLQMPRMNGFEFLHALRNLEGHTHQPVIAISGLASSADHRRIKAGGFAGHVDKPFDDVRLLAAIEDAMTRRSPTA